MRLGTAWVLLGVAACGGDPASRCDAPFDAWGDADGDGFGGGDPSPVCALADGQVDRGLDCDDADAAANPDAAEACDGRDNDCDGQIDDDQPVVQWWLDADGDGFGAQFPSQLACAAPGLDWTTVPGDCDDTADARSPDASEVCDGGDEDCDGLDGDFDPSTDPATMSTFFRDADGDNFGDPDHDTRSCTVQRGWSGDATDCNDLDPLVGQRAFYADADHDGYGDPAVVQHGCATPPEYVANALDCDDAEPALNIAIHWYDDQDGDGFGGLVPIALRCDPPSDVAVTNDLDCDDDDGAVHPGAADRCHDGLDTDCNGSDECRSCAEVLEDDPTSATGPYPLAPAGATVEVWCDMDTDGGGWTLVSSTRGTPPDDASGGWYADLGTMAPGGGHPKVWAGLRSVVTDRSDLRFSCTTAVDPVVDLSFYDVGWYREITTGSDADSCFNEGAGVGADPPPARRDNLTGDVLPAGDPWAAGFLQGEDQCGSTDDFTVDFDDRGLNGDQSDGTDWGEDDGVPKCGTNNTLAIWYLWVREP
ncbi:MAG: MopE-related protein [Myxococcota bacterium]